MPHYQHLIVGGGMAAAAAIRGIAEVDPEAAIGVVGSEPDRPYNRPPLTKGLWKGEPQKKIWRKIASPHAELHLGRTIRSLDLPNKQAVDDAGETYAFDKLLLATGGTPRRLPFGDDRIIYYRTLEDYRRLRALTEQGDRFAVIGSGFIGSEIAAALAMNGKQVTMIFPEEVIGERVFPPDLARSVTDYYREKGVEVLAGGVAVNLEDRGSRLALTARGRNGERELEVDGVVAGLGIVPNVELARAAGLAVDNGIIVDEYLRTPLNPDVYAAGDVASFENQMLGRRLRYEHEDHANQTGRAAGRAMAGKPEPYHHVPFFYSDLFDLGYEAVGDLNSQYETVADWKTDFREGVVYYLRDGRVRGVLLWNVWDQVDAARKLIAEDRQVRPADLIGRLPEASAVV